MQHYLIYNIYICRFITEIEMSTICSLLVILQNQPLETLLVDNKVQQGDTLNSPILKPYEYSIDTFNPFDTSEYNVNKESCICYKTRFSGHVLVFSTCCNTGTGIAGKAVSGGALIAITILKTK